MSLKSSNNVETNRYQLEVEVDAETFGKAIDQAYRKNKNKINVPGFRKGKAPRSFIEKYYGDQVFYEDAINAVYPNALDEAVKEAKLDMIQDKIDFDIVEVSKDGLTFKATITTKPEVAIEGYKGLEVTKKSVEVTDEDLENEIKKVQERNSRMVTVEDRAAQNGDVAVIDFEGFLDGEPFEGGKAENYSLNLGTGQFIPGFEDQVVGHSANEEFEINVTFPEDYQVDELKNQSVAFKINLHEVKTKELPEVDDDFVKDISSFDTLDDYKKDLREKLAEVKENEAKDNIDNQLIDQLIEKLQAEIPEAMYDNKINDNIRDFSYRLQSQGLNLDTYMKYTGMTADSLRGNFKPQAERQVKIRLALEKIAALEEIKPTEDEINEEYEKLAKSYEMEAEKVKTFIPVEDLTMDIAVEKAISMVRDSANVKDAE